MCRDILTLSARDWEYSPMYTGSCGNISAPWRQWFRTLLKFFGQPTFTLRTFVTFPNCLFHIAGSAPVSRICLCSFSSVKPCHTSTPFPVGTSESHLNLHLALRTTLTSKSHPKPHCDDPKRVAANVLSAEILRTKALASVLDPIFLVHLAPISCLHLGCRLSLVPTTQQSCLSEICVVC